MIASSWFIYLFNLFIFQLRLEAEVAERKAKELIEQEAKEKVRHFLAWLRNLKNAV